MQLWSLGRRRGISGRPCLLSLSFLVRAPSFRGHGRAADPHFTFLIHSVHTQPLQSNIIWLWTSPRLYNSKKCGVNKILSCSSCHQRHRSSLWSITEFIQSIYQRSYSQIYRTRSAMYICIFRCRFHCTDTVTGRSNFNQFGCSWWANLTANRFIFLRNLWQHCIPAVTLSFYRLMSNLDFLLCKGQSVSNGCCSSLTNPWTLYC